MGRNVGFRAGFRGGAGGRRWVFGGGELFLREHQSDGRLGRGKEEFDSTLMGGWAEGKRSLTAL